MNRLQQVDSVAELLRSAGPREDAPTERVRRVELAVRVEWQTVVRHRHRRTRARRLAGGSLATAAAAALFFQAMSPPAAHLAATAAVVPASTYVAVRDLPAPSAEIPAEDVVPGFSRVRTASRPRHAASVSASVHADSTSEGLPRRVFVNYAWETR